MSMEELFRDDAYCGTQIMEARRLFGTTKTTEDQLDRLMRTLAFMYLHCSEELQSAVLATMDELEKRRLYSLLHIMT